MMLLSAMPFVLHLQALRRGPDALLQDEQVRLFLWIIVCAIASLFVWRVVWNEAPMLDAMREAAFNVVSTISTTGFTSTHQDHAQWGGFPAVLLLTMMLVGGCTGSTAGGIKMFRLRVLLSALRVQARRQIYPHGTFVIVYNGAPVADTVRAGVTLYFFVYLSTFMLFALALAFCGLAIRGEPGRLGDGARRRRPWPWGVIGPCCTFAPLPDPAKWLLTVEMLAGRLEILVLMIPLTRTFWRDLNRPTYSAVILFDSLPRLGVSGVRSCRARQLLEKVISVSHERASETHQTIGVSRQPNELTHCCSFAVWHPDFSRATGPAVSPSKRTSASMD